MSPLRLKGRFANAKQINRKKNQLASIARRNLPKEDEAVSSEPCIDGRRIVEPAVLAEQMWCNACQLPLSFRTAEKEIRHGLSSTFKVRCHKCTLLHSVKTSKEHTNPITLNPVRDVNCKAAVG